MLWKGLLLTVVLLVIYSLVYVLASEQLDELGLWLSRNLGYAGVALFSLFVDMFIMPTSVDILFPFVMQWRPVPLLLVMGAASSLGGYTGYWIARSFNHVKWIERAVEKNREKGTALISRYGPWAVVFAGITPVPFSAVCWISGITKAHAGWTAAACLSRFPRMVIYYLLIRGGILILS